MMKGTVHVSLPVWGSGGKGAPGGRVLGREGSAHPPAPEVHVAPYTRPLETRIETLPPKAGVRNRRPPKGCVYTVSVWHPCGRTAVSTTWDVHVKVASPEKAMGVDREPEGALRDGRKAQVPVRGSHSNSGSCSVSLDL